MIRLTADQMRAWNAVPEDGSRLAYHDCMKNAKLRPADMERISIELEDLDLVRYNQGLRTLQRISPQPLVLADTAPNGD